MSLAIDYDRRVVKTDSGELAIRSFHGLDGSEVPPDQAHWVKVVDEDEGEALLEINQ